MQADTLQLVALITGIGAPVLAAGGAFWAVKYGLNGAKENIKDIKAGMGKLLDGQHRTEIAVAEVRTEMRETQKWVGALEQRLERHMEDE